MRHYRELTCRYMQGQRRRTYLTVAGIILSVALMTSIGTMLVSFRDFEIREAVKETGDYHVRYTQVRAEVVQRMRGVEGVERVAVVVSEGDAVVAPVSERERAGGRDIPPYRYLKLKSMDHQALQTFTISLREGRLPRQADELVVEESILPYLPGHPGLGDTIALDIGTRCDRETGLPIDEYAWSGNEVFTGQTSRQYIIVGLTRAPVETSRNYLSNGITYLDSQRLQSISAGDAYVKMKSVHNIQVQAAKAAKESGWEKPSVGTGPGSSMEFNDKVLRLSAQSTNSILNKGMLMIVSFIILLVMVCTIAVIYNSFNISVLERVAQFGTLRCIGAAPDQIRRLVLQEAALMSGVGIPLGLFCGWLAVKVVLYGINLIDNNALVIMNELRVIVSPLVLAGGTVLGLVTVFLSALGPARQAGKIAPLEAVRQTGSYSKEDLKKVPGSGIAGFLFGFEGRLASKNLRRNRKRFHITVFSMVISIVLYIVFGSFVNYLFYIGAANQGADADYVLSVREGEEGSVDERHYRDIKRLPGVERAYQDMTSEMRLEVSLSKVNHRLAELKGELLEEKQGHVVKYPVQLCSYGKDSLEKLQQQFSSGDLEDMNRENGVVLVATSRIYDAAAQKFVMVQALDLRAGDSVRLYPAASGTEKQPVTLKIMGVREKDFLSDSYQQDGEVLLLTTQQVYQRITGRADYRQVAIKLAPGAQGESVSRYLKKLTGENPRYEYIDFAEVMESMRNAALTMSIFLYGFVAVIALIGCLNIINTISTNLILRRRELAALKAVGMTAQGVKKLVGLEGLLYGGVAIIYGTLIGTLLSYLLSRLFSQNIIEFAWRVPWPLLTTASLGAIIIALVAGYIPLKRMNRRSIVEGLRMEE